MSSKIRVLEIAMSSLDDLIRLAFLMRRENSILLSYPVNQESYSIGFYIPSIAENFVATFPYLITEEKPPSLISFSSSIEGNEVISKKPISSSQYTSIHIAHLQSKPHKEVDPSKTDCAFSMVETESLMSIVKLGLAASTEDYLPFLWFDHSHNKYVIAIGTEGSDDFKGGLIIFDYNSSAPQVGRNYIKYRLVDGSEELHFTKGIDDYSAQYIAIINVNDLPYYKFKIKRERKHR